MPLETPTIEDVTSVDQSEKEIQFEEIAELESPIKIIIERIKSKIENGEYGLIIGDDASGRVPALILGNFIREVHGKNEHVKPNIIFIPGKIRTNSIDYFEEEDAKYLEDYIEKKGATKDKRILIVTDTVMSGNSLKTLVRRLKKVGYACDIATIGVEEPMRSFVERKINLGNTKIISGKYNNGEVDSKHTPKLYDSHELSGVKKEPGGYTSASLKDMYRTDRKRQEIQDKINKTREDGKVLTDKLLDWYLTKHEE